MKYVVKMFNEYWLRECEDHMEELYDLESATQYDSKEDAKKAISRFTMGEYCKIVEYARARRAFIKWRDAGMIRRKIPVKSGNWSRHFDPNKDGLLEIIQFHTYAKQHEHEIDYDDYKTWPDNINSYLDHFYNMEAYYEDMKSRKLLFTFHIMITKEKADFNKFKDQLETLLPYVTYKGDFGYRFPIFDKDLSQYGTRYLEWDPVTDKAEVAGYDGDLEYCFNIIKRDYYYE